MRPDSSAIANALIAKLGADTELLALVPNGIYEDLAPPNAQRFVIVSQILATDTPVFLQGRVIEDHYLLVEARVRSSTNGDVRAAAARIDALLEDGTLEIPNYRLMTMHREEFVRGTEIDEVDPTIVWKRRGGRYRVQAYFAAVVSAVTAENLYEPPAAIGGLDIQIWFDGPLKIPNPTNIRVRAVSSDPARFTSYDIPLHLDESDLFVSDPLAPGHARLRFRQGLDFTGCAGLTFTISDASARTNWDQILSVATGQPVADSLAGVTLVITVGP